MPLLVHGEVTDADVDIFDREAVFIERVLIPLLRDFPGLKVVFEHITTQEAADFVSADTSGRLGATITAHHLVINRSHIFAGGIRPHLYCLPVAKRERHRLALRRAATSGPLRSSSAPTAPRIRSPPRRAPAAAPASSPRRSRSRSMPRSSRRKGRSTASRPSPASTARASTACRSTRTRSRWSRPTRPCPKSSCRPTATPCCPSRAASA